MNKAKQFSCKTCSKRLKTNYNLKYHNEMFVKVKEIFLVGLARGNFTLQSLKEHEKCKLEIKQIIQMLYEVLEIKMRNEIWIILMGRARGYTHGMENE